MDVIAKDPNESNSSNLLIEKVENVERDSATQSHDEPAMIPDDILTEEIQNLHINDVTKSTSESVDEPVDSSIIIKENPKSAAVDVIEVQPCSSVDNLVSRPDESVVSHSLSSAAAACGSGGNDAGKNEEKSSAYKIKTIKWCDENMPIITQNENGPCPLIAIVNCLLLTGKKNPFGSKTTVTAEEIMSYLGNIFLQSRKNFASSIEELNYEKNMNDAIPIFPRLQTGLDVNVRFTGVRDFEYTQECIIFDTLNIPLYHGWLVDPQDPEAANAVGKRSYNQLVERIITNKTSPDTELVTEALICENFLESTASQLTHYGLCELNNLMKSGEMAVLFRNNHFSTIYKHKHELFQLVTDQGFLPECNVVWETLSNIDGDGEFVDGNFVTVPPKPVPSGSVAINPIDEEEQISQDLLLALSLQKEESREEEIAANWEEYKAKELGITSEVSDEELAWRLHNDEQKQAQVENETRRATTAPNPNEQLPKPQSSSDGNPGQPPKKKSECTIL